MGTVRDRMPAWESACRLRACGPQWHTVEQPQPRWGRSAAMVEEELGVNIAVCPGVQLISHTQPTSTLSRIKCEGLYFYKEVCSFIHWSSYIVGWLCSAYICMYIMSIQQSEESNLKERDDNIRLAKTWAVIDKLSIIRKSDLSNKIKLDFFLAAVVSILLYGCTKWTLIKRIEKNLNRTYTRMLRVILINSWKQHPTKRLLPSQKLSKTNKTCGSLEKQGRTYKWRSSMNLPVFADQQDLAYNSSPHTQDVIYKTCQEWWMLGTDEERESGKSVPTA